MKHDEGAVKMVVRLGMMLIGVMGMPFTVLVWTGVDVVERPNAAMMMVRYALMSVAVVATKFEIMGEHGMTVNSNQIFWLLFLRSPYLSLSHDRPTTTIGVIWLAGEKKRSVMVQLKRPLDAGLANDGGDPS